MALMHDTGIRSSSKGGYSASIPNICIEDEEDTEVKVKKVYDDTREYALYHPEYGFLSTDYEILVTSKCRQTTKYWLRESDSNIYWGTVDNLIRILNTADWILYRGEHTHDILDFLRKTLVDCFVVGKGAASGRPDFVTSLTLHEVKGNDLRRLPW